MKQVPVVSVKHGDSSVFFRHILIWGLRWHNALMSHKAGAERWRAGEEVGSHSSCGSRRFCHCEGVKEDEVPTWLE